MARDFEAGELPGAMRDQLLLGRACPIGQFDKRGGHFGIAGIGQADDLRQIHCRMALQHRLDFGSSDILAANLEHVLGPAVEHHISASIDRADIAGVKPAFSDGLSRLFGGVVISFEHVRSAQHDLALLAHAAIRAGCDADNPHFPIFQRSAAALGAHLIWVRQAAGRDRSGGLGQAIRPHLNRVRHCGGDRFLDPLRLHRKV